MNKRIVNPLIVIYQWLIFVPVFAVATVITALATMLFAAIFGDKRITHLPARHWARLACYGMFMKIKVVGAEKISYSRSYVFAANHQSMYDIFLVYGWLDSRFKWIMKKELRRIPFVGKACESAGHVFIDRSSPMAAKRSIEIAEKKLINGASVVIFPEGTRTKDGKLGKFKRGAFMLASELKLPIVPITITGTFKALPISCVNIIPAKLTLTIHDPIVYLPEYDENHLLLVNKVHEAVAEGL